MLKKISCSFIIVIALAGNMSCSVSKARQVTPTAVQRKTVSDITELNQAIASAKPGDVIVMNDGEWSNAVIDFTSTATANAPVVLKAKTAGKVILTGSSKLTFSKPYLKVEGLYFTGGSIKGHAVIEFKSDYGTLTNSAVVDYNPADKATGYYWVFFSGNHNKMERCFFKGKNHMQPIVGNDQDNSRHNSVSYCHFKDIPHSPENGREIFRIWGYGRSEETGDDGAFFTIESNLFERAHGEGSEIVSLKSNRNIVRFNTIVSTRGGITNRSGNFNTIEGNFVFGNNERGTSGIRIAGQGHRVFNNYISDVSGDGLIIMTGEYIDTFLTDKYNPVLRAGTPLGRVPRYGHVKNALFANNTIVNVGGLGMNVGSSYNANPAADQRVLIPENNRIVNNLIYKSKMGGVGITVTTPNKKRPLDRFIFKPNLFEGNISFGSDSNTISNGIIVANPMLALKNGLYRPTAGSIAIDKGIQIDIKEDLDGQLRSGKIDIGADEVSASAITRKPLTDDDTGAAWIIQMRKAGSKAF